MPDPRSTTMVTQQMDTTSASRSNITLTMTLRVTKTRSTMLVARSTWCVSAVFLQLVY